MGARGGRWAGRWRDRHWLFRWTGGNGAALGYVVHETGFCEPDPVRCEPQLTGRRLAAVKSTLRRRPTGLEPVLEPGAAQANGTSETGPRRPVPVATVTRAEGARRDSRWWGKTACGTCSPRVLGPARGGGQRLHDDFSRGSEGQFSLLARVISGSAVRVGSGLGQSPKLFTLGPRRASRSWPWIVGRARARSGQVPRMGNEQGDGPDARRRRGTEVRPVCWRSRSEATTRPAVSSCTSGWFGFGPTGHYVGLSTPDQGHRSTACIRPRGSGGGATCRENVGTAGKLGPDRFIFARDQGEIQGRRRVPPASDGSFGRVWCQKKDNSGGAAAQGVRAGGSPSWRKPRRLPGGTTGGGGSRVEIAG